MSKAQIDELQIVISANDEGAVDKIDELISYLKKLDDASNNSKGAGKLEQIKGEAENAIPLITKVGTALDGVESKKEKVSGIGKNTEAFSALENSLDGVGKKAEQTAQRIDDSFSGGKAQQMADAIQKARVEQARYNSELRNTSGESTFTRIRRKIREVAKETEKTRAIMRRLGKTIGRPFLTPFAEAKSLVGGLAGEVTHLMKNFKRVALYRALRESVRMVTEGIRTGIDNAYQWALVMESTFGDGVKSATQFRESMDSLATSSLYLKNSLGAMAMPLINMVAPAVDAVIDKLVSLFNVINRLFATISGATTWTRALKYPKSYGEALDDAGRSAGKLKDELITILGIDEINPMEGAKDPTGSGSGAGALADDYGSMFEEVALESDKISEFLGELFDPLKKAWDTKGEAVMKAFDTALSGINTLVMSVGSSFWEVWTNGTGQKSVEHLLGTLEGILLTVGNIANAFAKGWNTDNLGTRIIQHLWDMLNDILGMWEEIALATAEWAKGLDLEPIIRSFEKFTEKLEPLVKLISEGLAWGWKNVLLPLGKWTIEKGLPAVIDVLAEAIGALKTTLEILSPWAKSAWDNFFKPVAEWTADLAIQALQDMAKGINDINSALEGTLSWEGAFEGMFERLSSWFAKFIYGIGHGFMELGVQIGKALGVEDVALQALKEYEENLGYLKEGRWSPAKPTYILDADKPFEFGETPSPSSLNGSYADKAFRVPVIAEGLEFENHIPEGEAKVDNVIAGAGTLRDDITKGKVINGVEAKADRLADSMTASAKSIGGVSAIATELDDKITKRKSIGDVIAEASSLVKTKGTSLALADVSAQINKTDTSKLSATAKTISAVANFTTKNVDKKFDNKFGSVANFIDRTVDKKKVPTVWSGWVAEFVKRRKDDATMPTVWGGWTALFVKRKKDNNELPTVWSGWTAKFDDRKIGFSTDLKMTAKITKFNADRNTPIEVGGAIKGYVAEKGGAFYNGMWHNIPQYASGGLPNHGSMFIAGEAGAELVGHIGGHTEVLNQSQMASALAEGMAPQAQLLQQLVTIGEQILAEQGDRNVVVSTSAIAEGFQRMNRREGRTIVPVGA